MAQTPFIAKHGLIVGQNEIVDTLGNLTVPGDVTITGEIVRSGVDSPYATESFVSTALSNLVDTAPTTLDTLNELAAALGDDSNFATTITTALGTKLASADFDSTFDTRLATKSSDDISEGSNLYFTNGRVDQHLSGSTGVTYNFGEISIGQDVSTSSNVTFADVQATNFIGNASTSSKWITPRIITLGGDLSGSVSVDGSSDVTLTATVDNLDYFATAAQGTLADSALQPDGDGSALTGIVAGLEWSRKIANYTTSNNDAVIADTSGGVWTLTLPASPSLGDLVRVTDGADWSANNLTVARNGSTIEGDAADMTMDIGGGAVDFVYDGTTWQIYAQVGPLAGNSPTFAGLTVDGNVGIGTSSPTATLNVVANTTSDALRITQTGSGNAFVVEDSTSPDSTPFVINATGKVIQGYTTLQTGAGGVQSNVQISATNSSSGIQSFVYSATSTASAVTEFLKSASGSVGTNTTVVSGGDLGVVRWSGADGTNFIRSAEIKAQVDGTPGTNDMPGRLVFSTTADGASSPTERLRITSAGNVGIGTSSPSTVLHTAGANADSATTLATSTSNAKLRFQVNTTSSLSLWQGTVESGSKWYAQVANGPGTTSYDMVINPFGGSLLVGKTAVDNTTVGFRFDGSSGFSSFVRDGGEPLYLNRKTSDGDILKFAKDGSIVGRIGTVGSCIYIGSSESNLRFNFGAGQAVIPVTSAGAVRDNIIDLGESSARFDDIYATNGTIQTSDRNEKQDIEVLSEAEARVAVACKGLLRKFRWKDSVAERGDEARIHFGIIAQDLQDAFAAEGLDAGRYAMFISSTWTDEETGEERTRLGVRYPELLAFIIAAI